MSFVQQHSLLAYERIAMLGKDEDQVRISCAKIIKNEDQLGHDSSEIECGWLTIFAVWLACRSLMTAMASRHAKMLDDPSIVPSLPNDDHIDFRTRFMSAHPDSVLIVSREPHKKFTERLNRDMAVTGSVLFYELGEIRTRAEQIVQKSGVAQSVCRAPAHDRSA